MKKIALLLTVLVLPLMLTAQKTPIDKLFDKYYGKEGFTTVLVNEDMFEVISNMEEAKGEHENVLGNIKRVRVIAQDDEFEETEAVNFMEEVKGMEFDDYKPGSPDSGQGGEWKTCRIAGAGWWRRQCPGIG